ncbi:MAG: ATP-binding protein [Actinomycetota bacterium]
MLDSVVLPLHFTVEFVGFVVFAGAVFLIWFRPSFVPAGRFGRMVAALGFAVLAGAQIAHGAAFIEADGDPQLIAARAAGLVFVAMGLARADLSRGTPILAGAAVRLREPLSLIPVTAALILVLVALNRARKGAVELRRLALGAFLLGVFEALTGVFLRAELGIGSIDPLVHAAHAAKLLGFVLVAAWLWSSIRASVRSRFVAAFAALLLAVVLALSSTLTGVISRNVETEELNRIESQLENAVRNIQGESLDLAGNAQLIAQQATVRSQLAARRDLDVLARSIGKASPFAVDLVALTAPGGKLLAWFGDGPVLGRTGRNAKSLDADVEFQVRVIGTPVLTEVTPSDGVTAAASLVHVEDVVVALAAAEVPGRRAGARPAGVIAVGRYVDALTLEAITDAFAPARATLVSGGEVIATSMPRRVPLDDLVPASVNRELVAGTIDSAEQELGDDRFFSAFAPLLNEAGVPVGTLVLTTPADVITATRRADVTRSLFLVTLAVGAVALLLAWLSGRRITRPIQELTNAANAVREGDLTAKAKIVGHDEVGQLGSTFNEMTGALIGMTDDLRNAARQERDLRARLETIMQSMTDGLVAVSTDGSVFAFNAASEDLTGLGADEAVGKPLDDVLDVRDANGEKRTFPLSDVGTGSVGSAYLMRRSGQPLPVAVTSAVIKDAEGNVAGAVVVVRDISREHEVEKMKTEFLSNISHELRTPLTPIKGYSELLASRDLPPDKAKRFATGIRDSTERLERVVELLVDFAALEAGRLAPRARPVEIPSVIESLVEQWRKRSPKHTFVVETVSDLPSVAGDERLLRRSLEEILDNSVKFSPDGGTIRIEARRRDDGAGVEIVVSDEGIGISPEELPHVFADFHQIDASETRSYGGMGLGLAFVQRIVEAHRGEVLVASEQQEGTQMTIRLPLGRTGSAG